MDSVVDHLVCIKFFRSRYGLVCHLSAADLEHADTHIKYVLH